MIKNNSKRLNRLHIVIDAIIMIGVYAVSYVFRFGIFQSIPFFTLAENEKYLSFAVYMYYLFPVVPGYLLIYYMCGLYRPWRSKSRFMEVWNLVKANIIGIFFFFALLYLFEEMNLSRKMIVLFAFCNTMADLLFRILLRKILDYARKKGYNQKHVLIVGYSRTAEGYIDRILASPRWGYHIAGILDNRMEIGTKYKEISVFGKLDALEEQLEKHDYDEIIITLSVEEYALLDDVVLICEKSGAHTRFIPDYMNVIPSIPDIEDFEGLAVINIRKLPLADILNRLIKRMMDLLFGILLTLIAALPMLLIAFLIKITSRGPVFFVQERVGLHNKVFRMIKFRSMEMQKRTTENTAWTTAKDPRVTGIGKIIRKTSLDELPQLFNVLKGDMSLVGPRPERPFYVEKFKEEIPRYMVKHQVRPGMTGWAQVNGFRGDTSIRKRIEYDLYYIENWSVGFDMKILFLTVFKGFISKDAY